MSTSAGHSSPSCVLGECVYNVTALSTPLPHVDITATAHVSGDLLHSGGCRYIIQHETEPLRKRRSHFPPPFSADADNVQCHCTKLADRRVGCDRCAVGFCLGLDTDQLACVDIRTSADSSRRPGPVSSPAGVCRVQRCFQDAFTGPAGSRGERSRPTAEYCVNGISEGSGFSHGLIPKRVRACLR